MVQQEKKFIGAWRNKKLLFEKNGWCFHQAQKLSLETPSWRLLIAGVNCVVDLCKHNLSHRASTHANTVYDFR